MIQVREARPEEFPEVAQVTVAAYSEYAVVLGEERWAAYRQDLSALEERSRHARILLAEEDGQIAGAVSLYPPSSPKAAPPEPGSPPDGWAWIRALAVAPGKRRRGVGTALTEECIRLARLSGARAIALYTTSAMPSAIALYEKLGFLRRPDLDHESAIGLEVPAYFLPLAPPGG